MRFRPRRFPYSSIVVDGHSGYVSMQAFHWLSNSNVPVFIMNFDGSIISSILPPSSVNADLRAAQIQAVNDPRKKYTVVQAFVQAKIARSLQVLDWLGQRYDVTREARLAEHEAAKLPDAASVSQLRTVEGRVALRYWETLGKALPDWLEFQGRMTTSHSNNASDRFNAALNYGYGFLEAECRMAVHAVGLEPSVGFLHDFSDYQTKQSLVYDLEEPFRWLIDLSVLQAFESKTLQLHDFYFTGDDYRYRFEPDAKIRFIKVLREQFNKDVRYKGRVLKWDTVIEQKLIELSRFLAGRSPRIDLTEPSPILQRIDNAELRWRISSMTSKEAKRLRISKQTLHDLRTRARRDNSFRVYPSTMAKLHAPQT